MKIATLKWMEQETEAWLKVCRAQGRAFKKEELIPAMKNLLKMAKDNADSSVILLVFLTEYEEELAFIEGKGDRGQKTRG